MMRETNGSAKPIQEITTFNGPVESGFFSKTNGGTFATTDQRQEVRFYCTSSSSDWKHEVTVDHPQDTFQHLTPIKGFWHPMVDLFGVSRYNSKDKNDSRGIDFFDPKGFGSQRIFELNADDTFKTFIKSVNVWNSSGDTLATSASANLIIWKKKEFMESIFDKLHQHKMTQEKDSKHDKKTPSNDDRSRDELFREFLNGTHHEDKSNRSEKRKKKTTTPSTTTTAKSTKATKTKTASRTTTRNYESDTSDSSTDDDEDDDDDKRRKNKRGGRKK